MGITEDILAKQLETDAFYGKNAMVSGIARLAVSNGFDALSASQKDVLTPYLSYTCSGQVDPGGHRNNCKAVLEGSELLDAYNYRDGGDLQCESCREEGSYYEAQWDRFDES